MTKGTHHSEETKKKIIKARKRQVFTEETRKKMSIAGSLKTLSPEHRKKISLAHKGKKHKPTQGFQGGNKNSNWNGGISPELVLLRKGQENRLWREAVRTRDDWTCQKCGARECKLNNHHIQNFVEFPELRFAISNGITFCVKCHIIFHRKYGYKKNNEEQLYAFLSA